MLRVLIATTIRNHRVNKRAYPFSFIFGRLVMGAYTAMFSYFVYYYMFKGNIDSKFQTYTGSSDYMTYVILGASLHVFAASVLMNVGRSLMNELREGTLHTLLMAPASRKGYFLGSMIEQIGRSLLEFLIILGLGWMLGARFTNLRIDQFLIIWFLSLLGFFALGISLASVMLYIRDTYISQNTLFTVMNMVCGVAFPVEYLPKWLQPISHLFPLTPALKLFRNVVMSGQTIIQNIDLVGELAVLSLAYLLFGFWWICRGERKFIEKSFG